MAKISPMMLAPLVIFAAFAGLAARGLFRENPDELPSALIGKTAPAVEVSTLGDKPPFEDAHLRQDGLKIVNFWASWCAPCRAEHPNLMKLTEMGIPIYGVNYKDKPENALGFLAELGDPYTAIGADAAGRMGINWGVYGVPETYIVDAKGQILLRFAGPITKRHLKDTILPAIEGARGD